MIAKKDEISKDSEFLTLGYRGYGTLPYKAKLLMG